MIILYCILTCQVIESDLIIFFWNNEINLALFQYIFEAFILIKYDIWDTNEANVFKYY